MDPDLIERLLHAEMALLNPEVRAARAALERWLDPDFTEIGQSGRLWSREEVIRVLLANDQSGYARAESTEFRVTVLAEGCYLLTYLIELDERRSRRSSIWRECDGALVMLFHQGTPTE